MDTKSGSGGLNSIKFGPHGTMFGPFDDANTTYHKSGLREHFNDDNPKLCFACHHNLKNELGLEVYATGKEYDIHKNSEQQEGCKKCHMSDKREGVASNFSMSGEEPRKRMVRDHRFASVDNSNIFNEQIEVKDSKIDDNFIISLTNKAPHNVPTGYGLREIVIQVKFFDSNDKMIEQFEQKIGAMWKDKRGNITIPHLAKSIARDTRLRAKSTKEYQFKTPDSAKSVKYSLYYKLINSYMAKEIGVTDEFFLKDYILIERRVRI